MSLSARHLPDLSAESVMPFFAMQYRVLFHDTMAYGSHHYLTNLKFQNIARETALFETSADAETGRSEQLENIVMLTREAYCSNLAPVNVGEKVAIFMTYADPSRSTVRLCFRVVHQCGHPVSCGYQTMVLTHRETHELVQAPPSLAQFLNADAERNLIEPLTQPSFADLARSGSSGVRHMFPESIRRLGKSIANAPIESAYPKIVDENLREYALQE
jgi:acyl-CoA thioesterase FadM